ncbi:MAG: hypothetical protein H6Q87_916 [candidate division NC10 bacterium]|nr:hypothetical protein [candidate division NC10 bacterium]
MGRAVGAEAVAVRRERPVPAPLEHLQHRLLEEAVQDGGHPELPSASPWLGNLDPLHRLRLVGTLEQLRPEGWPVFREVARQLLDGHPVHSRTPLVGLDTSQCCRQVCTLDDLLHHLVGVGRAFGCARRRGRFGPFPCRRRSFTLLSCREGQVDLAFLPPAAHEMRPPTDRSLYPLAGTVRAFGDVRPPGFPARFPHLLYPWLTSARGITARRRAASPESGTPSRSPEVSSTAVRARPPDLRFAPLMDMDFAVTRPLVRRARLVSGSCPSTRAFARRFLQTAPRGDALAGCYPFTSIRLGRGLAPPSCRTCSAHVSIPRQSRGLYARWPIKGA